MILEAIETPIHYRWPEGEICLIPGQPVDVSTERGAKILKRCGSKVRVVAPLIVECWVEFRSTLFGLCTGRVLNLELEAVRISEHSVIKEVVTIPAAWITRTLEGV